MPPALVDTHAHLTDRRFARDLPAVLERAVAAGVTRTVVVAITADDSPECVALAERYPAQLAATVGIHPNSAFAAPPADWDTVLALAQRPSVHGIGETGLDRHWDKTPFPLQEEYFAQHLDLGRRLGKAVVIHTREAEADIVRMLRADFDRHGPIRGVLHSYCGDWPHAAAALAMGLHVSFAGMLTYKTAENVREVAAQVPLDRILVETDCPYLSPVPHRGKRNEPAYTVHTTAVLAEVRGIALEELAAATTRNAHELFKL